LSDEPLLVNEEGQQGNHFPVLDESTEVILEKLKEVDPVMADRWHPNERRKIQRSLEIYLKTGKPASQVYDEQRLKREISLTTTNGEGSATCLRFPTLLFWVHASKDVLSTRLDGRINKMMQNGLLSEVQTLSNFAASYEKRSGAPVDSTRGIWVSIGYKEFLDYQAALADPSGPRDDLAKMRHEAVAKAQAATRQYAKRQIRWIQIKLLNAAITAGQRGNMFLLDGSELRTWEKEVMQPAIDVTQHFLLGNPLPDPCDMSQAAKQFLTPKRDYDLAQRPDLWQKKICDTCGTVAVTANDWHLHIKSRGHKRAVSARKKQESSQCSATSRHRVVAEDELDPFQNSPTACPVDLHDVEIFQQS
jgi:tRNA dimethylallyltransferase